MIILVIYGCFTSSRLFAPSFLSCSYGWCLIKLKWKPSRKRLNILKEEKHSKRRLIMVSSMVLRIFKMEMTLSAIKTATRSWNLMSLNPKYVQYCSESDPKCTNN